jgi:hypothetical protein
MAQLSSSLLMETVGAPSRRSVCCFVRQRPKALRVGRPNKGELFFSVNFEILGKIKNAQIRNFILKNYSD